MNSRRELAARMALATLCFLAAWSLFEFFHSQILAARPGTDPALLTPWVRAAAPEHDGVELMVATLGTFALLGVALLVALAPWPFAKLVPWPLQLLAWAVLAWVVAGTSLSEFHGPSGAALLWPALAALGASAALHLAARPVLASRWRWVPLAVLVPALAVVVTVRMGFWDPDWSYLVAPAQKLLQGARPGDFYAQYNWFGTGFVFLLMKAGVRLHQMHLAMGLLFGAWYALYALLAARMLRRPALVMGLMLALIAVRCLAIREGPVFSPQVSVNRLDLWVPVLLALQSWGLASRRSAAVVTVIYLGDSTFGLIYLALYLGFLAVHLFEQLQQARALAPKLGACAAIPVAGLLLHAAIFGGIASSAGRHYADLQLGFLPIGDTSMVWPILAMLALSVPVFFARGGDRRLADVFLVFVAGAQCVYFYGRSHEHNLLNISAAWLFVAFTLLSRLTEDTERLGAGLSVALSSFFLVVSSGRALETWGKVKAVARDEGLFTYLFKPAPVDVTIEEKLKPLGWSGRLIAIDDYDGYLQHRLGLEHVGYYAPFLANARKEEVSRFLIDELSRGTRVVALNDRRGDLEDLSTSRAMQERGVALTPHEIPGGWEITLEPRP